MASETEAPIKTKREAAAAPTTSTKAPIVVDVEAPTKTEETKLPVPVEEEVAASRGPRAVETIEVPSEGGVLIIKSSEETPKPKAIDIADEVALPCIKVRFSTPKTVIISRSCRSPT